ncbi:multi-sensor hybrid histidine kinase [Rhodopirellula maiorica SM1]|uniref:Multi-sensor hybrid histidine kinase n=1 Tax=Rhodopirellula maiorica SM1 TaxID=1265738 RepID=M5S5L9_9BACT|nr:response regulator [Rhodopirellula maiorica]EMI22952.1 multi-sensor hybrid histidine kinase [Rhodopirellula maiorica SM1]
MGIASPKPEEPAIEPEVPKTPPRKILLVEDGAINQRVALGFLKKWNHEVELAVNGREAVEATKQQSFDVILMDIQMPEMNGLEATAAIRKSEEGTNQHQYIVAMTAEAMKGDREKCLNAGMDDYISKPFNPDELQDVIARATEHIAPDATDNAPEDAADAAPADRTADEPESTAAATTEDGETEPERQTEPMLDWDHAVRQMGGDENLALEVLRTFQDEVPVLLKQMRSAIEAKDPTTLCRSAHTLKGSSRFFGLSEIIEICTNIEASGQAMEIAAAEEAVDQLGKTCDRLLAEIANRLASNAAESDKADPS